MNKLLLATVTIVLSLATSVLPSLHSRGDDQGSDHRNVESPFVERLNGGPSQVSARGAAGGCYVTVTATRMWLLFVDLEAISASLRGADRSRSHRCDEDERRLDGPIYDRRTESRRPQGDGAGRHRIESGAPRHRPGLLHESRGQQTHDEVTGGNRADDRRNQRPCD